MPASKEYFLSYSDNERALLGSRRRFGVNVGFNDEDRILMENLYVVKGYGTNNLLRNFRINVHRMSQILFYHVNGERFI